MSLYDGLGVETAPVIELPPQVIQSNESPQPVAGLSGWSSSMKLMASHLQRQKMASKAQQLKARPPPSVTGAVEKAQKFQQATAVPVLQPARPVQSVELVEDDLAVEIADEYDPMAPNSYEQVLNQRKELEAKKEQELTLRREERNRERKRRPASDSGSDSDEEKKISRRKETAAIPPPSVLAPVSIPEPKPEEKPVIESPLEELSKIKAQRANPFAKPNVAANNAASSVATQIMSKYGWKEGQGLGKASQGISTALAVEKTSKRGGKIVNIAAEREQLAEQEKKKAQSLTDMLKNPTRVILLQNMVGPGEVDDDLQPEITEECTKYGEVTKCLIFEIPNGAPDDEAVRIFVEFGRLESSIKAVIDLNGRFFGGRQVRATFYPEDKFSHYELAP